MVQQALLAVDMVVVEMVLHLLMVQEDLELEVLVVLQVGMVLVVEAVVTTLQKDQVQADL